MNDLNVAFDVIQKFTRGSTSTRIAQIEEMFKKADSATSKSLLSQENIGSEVLDAASTLKRASGQIGEIVHALGILLVLPNILEEGEMIEHLSLAAGNTGRAYDLETNLRVAEFKFNRWQGGSEAIRQNQFFKDFYRLSEDKTPKKKYLYTTGITYPLKFLQGGRALKSVMSKNSKVWYDFQQQYGEQFTRVREYYTYKFHEVIIEDIDKLLPVHLKEALLEEEK